MRLIFFLIFLFLYLDFVKAQNKEIDSLKLALQNSNNDTLKANILSALTSIAPDGEWEDYNDLLKNLCEDKIKTLPKTQIDFKTYQKYYAASLDNLGLIYSNKSDLPKAMEYFREGLKIQEEIGDKSGIATSLNGIGVVYDSQGNIPKALEYYSKSLKIKEEIGDKYGIAYCLQNLGYMYNADGDNTKALEYYTKSLKMQTEIGNKHGIGLSLNGIGFIYYKQGDLAKAMEYHTKSLKIKEEIGDKEGVATSLSNIGAIYEKQGNDRQSMEYHIRSLKIREEAGYMEGIASSLNNIAKLYIKLGDTLKALEYYTKSLKVAQQIGYPDIVKSVSETLFKLYKKRGNTKLALQNHELYITMRDSLQNEENTKVMVKQQMQYEFDKKQIADSLKIVEERQISALKFEQEKTQRYILYGGLALVLLFAGFMYNRFKVTQKQKIIIEAKEKQTQLQNEIIGEQKRLVEEKHKEITDSINYAERIQRSFMASKDVLDANLSDYFILFKPKDVVSGDFYWANKLPNGNFALITADSTGHGVPGAIMSLLNITSIEKAIEQNNMHPNDILNHTRNTIIQRLKRDGSPEGGKDGMDCSLCIYDFNKMKLFVSAAHNPVWIIRCAPAKEFDFIEISPDKMPVGKHDKQDTSFTRHEIDLQKGDIVYSLTDGFPDQFGGEKGKKFMIKRLRELIIANAHLPLHEQKQLLEKTFADWVGMLEQIDDVTVIGVRI